MRALGTTKRMANRSLFTPLMLLAIISIILGSAAAMVYASRTAADALKTFVDLGMEVDTSIPVFVAVFGILGELILLILFTTFGLYRTGKKPPLLLLQENTNKNTDLHKQKVDIKVSASMSTTEKYSTASDTVMCLPTLDPLKIGKYNAAQHVLRYIAKHGRRALAKSLLALMLAALLSGAMGQYTAVRYSYTELYRNIDIKARFINGLPYLRALKVADSGYVHSPYYEFLFKKGEANFERAEIYMKAI